MRAMRIKTAFSASAAIVVALALSGCVAPRYHHSEACRQMTREQLAQVSRLKLSITHTAVSYQGRRVVVEGKLERSAAATNAADVGHAPGADSLEAALAAAPTGKPAAPTTLVGSLLARLSSSPRPPGLSVTAECTFSASGLKTFRWLSPGQLARTTPDTQDDAR